MEIVRSKSDVFGRAKAEAADMYFYGCVRSLRRSRDYIYKLMNMQDERKRKFLGLLHVRREMNPHYSRDHWFKYFIKEFSKEKTEQDEEVSG